MRITARRMRIIVGSSLVVYSASLALLLSFQGGIFAQSDTTNQTCPPNIVLTQPLSGQTLPPEALFEVANSSPYYVNEVVFLVDNNPIGAASRFENKWRLSLKSSSLPAGSHQVGARVHYYATTGTTSTTAGSSYSCITEVARDVKVASATTTTTNTTTTSTTKSLEVILDKTSWRGPTNVQAEFNAKVFLVANGAKTDVSSQAFYEWKTTLGSISGDRSVGIFRSGPQTGRGQVVVIARYGEYTKEMIVPIEVVAVSDAPAYPSTEPTAGTTTTATQQADQELTDCLQLLTGAVITSRLTFEQMRNAEQCLARRGFVLPANLAPVAPSEVKKLKVTDKAKIDKVETIEVEGIKKLYLKGIGPANSKVVIYVFSEPLVLVAETDNKGEWSYTLDDPLEEGSHEVYVALEGEEGAPTTPVRSESFGFAVAAAPVSDQNPLGLSLSLAQKNTSRYWIAVYVLGATAAILTATVAVIFYLRHNKKPANSTPDVPEQIQPLT